MPESITFLATPPKSKLIEVRSIATRFQLESKQAPTKMNRNRIRIKIEMEHSADFIDLRGSML